MNCNIDFTTSVASVHAMELDLVKFSGMSADEQLQVTFVVYDVVGGVTTIHDQWSGTWYADTDGIIRIGHLGNVWNRYILAGRFVGGEEEDVESTLMRGIYVDISYKTMAGATLTCTRKVWYCRDKSGLDFAAFSGSLPFLCRDRRTVAGCRETVYAVGSTVYSARAVATVVVDGVASTTNVGLTAHTGAWCQWWDASPSAIAGAAGNGTLVEYAVQLMQGSIVVDSIHYTLDMDHQKQLTQVCWLNRYGVYESMLLTGRETWAPKREAEYGFVGDEYSAMDVRVEDEYTLSTGLCAPATVNQVRDLAEAPVVWKLEGAIWKKICITDTGIGRKTPSNEAEACTITYRPAVR